MPAFEVSRSIEMAVPPETVFDCVADFGTWTKWSPWLGIDPDAVVTVSDPPNTVGSIYRWKGDVVGAGEIEHLNLDRPRQISEEIRFTKPFKSTSKVGFTFEATDAGTKVTWRMQGRLPWFLFWMRANMQTVIGMDYDRGLKMLREHLETGEVLSKIEVHGVQTVSEIDVYGVSDAAPPNNMGPAMERVFSASGEKLKQADVSLDAPMVSVYHPCDLKQNQFSFTGGFAVSNEDGMAAGLEHCHLPAGNALHIRHIGSYENLGNAWSGAYQYARYKKLKVLRQDAYEIYRNDPATTAPRDLITDIYLPLR
ncbi:Bacterial transcription activator, effector binding domain protein [Rhodopirellula maiorica SM1]|uniref:Bacterial transcription activator, effector binding domain protein n=1 Tax=Rhodopirellula maiorica SM1 TaxID=1265738 RepID=M5RQ58_9BACT|nr:SRPBCC family protein [Rhodopirellula maiorica]EMI21425.1 Bacterial transcription activator, effector binding domain protein [Rhodopirellula maiorica SM1]